ncbi:hypothetical protein Pcinc_037605 [Petrolisthes cinctipes]|uniref:NAD(P)-binding domain-containing protein n=1 Tax=Petrolisthes cinctipes TaxID=88211 RepID=A0AAE1ELD2_PETCI|nr:hypothetical protein Pcinc_037605 [Petrolisthes cinctipes]
MRLLVLGGTGQTGKEVVDQALKAGHSVTAFVRNPDKVNTTHQNLKVVKGDVFNDKSLKPVVEGQDACRLVSWLPPENHNLSRDIQSLLQPSLQP